MKKPLIQIKNLRKRFDGKAVLNGINITIKEGEITTIIGKSGVGKSVLLKHIIGLLEHDSGQILFSGKPFKKMKEKEKRSLKSKLSFMFQGTALFDSMTVFENVALPLNEKGGFSKKHIDQRVKSQLEQLDLHEIDNKYPSQLSGGMCKRVALARALITEPEIILFDEPTTGLDPIRKSAVHRMISDYQKQHGFTGILVSHEIPDIFYISQHIAMLDQGKIIFEGTPKQIYKSANPIVKEFAQRLGHEYEKQTGLTSQYSISGRLKGKSRGERRQNEDGHTIFSFIILNIMNMDEVIKKAGYEESQIVLKNFIFGIKKCLRDTDTCSRYDLNKILIVLPGTDLEIGKKVYTKLSNRMKKEKILDNEKFPGLSFSVDAAFAEAEEESMIEGIITNNKSKDITSFDIYA
jgi:phospholipid/cholesterol/gamma-HCH transport system ATP-binding protein